MEPFSPQHGQPDTSASGPDSRDPSRVTLELLARYFSDEASVEEAQSVERWGERDGQRMQLVGQVRKWWLGGRISFGDSRADAMELSRDETNVDEALARALRRIRTEPMDDAGREHGRRPYMASHRIGISVMLLAAVVAVIAWSTIRDVGSRRTDVEVMSTYSTMAGQRSEIMLSDGSVVFLNVGTRLRVAPDYGRRHRVVYLEGEAIFTVPSRSDAPFTVIAGHTVTHVLGTTFLVRRYSQDSIATVAVRSGRVAVGSKVVDAATEIEVEQSGRVATRTARLERFSFANGVMSLSSRPLADGIADLDRWYDAQVLLGDESLAHARIAGTFESGSVTDLKSILELMYDVRIIRNDRTLTLFRKEQ